MRVPHVPLLVAALCLLTPPAARGESLFDPARHMRVAEVRPGMTGYGLTVFRGTTVERFDVEVLSVLRSFSPDDLRPGYDVVLIRCRGQPLEHTGAIAGMSGSPIYLTDDAGRERMIGAFAYGWSMTKDPIAGVQPIEYMLELPTAAATTHPARAPSGTDQPAGASDGSPDGRAVWRWEPMRRGVNPPHRDRARGSATGLRPLGTPLMVRGLPESLVADAAPLFESMGVTPLQAGAAATSPSTAPGGSFDIRPGSVLGVPVVRGDLDLTAIGTVTDVVGDRVFGFGHPFSNDGPVLLPMTGGQVDGVIPNLMVSFKLGSPGPIAGALVSDQTVGVAGRLGESAPMVPVEYRVTYADGSLDRTYRFELARHRLFTPMLAAFTLAGSAAAARNLPPHHTVDYDLTFEFTGGRTVRAANRLANASIFDFFEQVAMPLSTAVDNPFERAWPTRISGSVVVTPEARLARITDVYLPRSLYRQGDAIRAFVTFRPWQRAEETLPVEIDVPRDLPDGTYVLSVGDWMTYLDDERFSQPFKFSAESIGQMFDVLREVAGVRRAAVYVRLARQPDGVAVGRTAMPQLPSSRREILLGGGRSNTTPFVSSSVRVVPTDYVMEGTAQFEIQVDRDLRPAHRLPRPQPQHQPGGPDRRDRGPGEPEPRRGDGDGHP